MRWKLIIVASLVAALAGTGACFAAAYFLFDPARNLRAPGWVAATTLLVPLAAVTYACIFVYRHTARRRILQAAATALLALLLILTALFLGSIILRRPSPEILPPARHPSNTS